MGKRILLVEGDDDRHVMWNLFDVRELAGSFSVEKPSPQPRAEGERDEGGGDLALLDSIPARLLESDLERLAVVLDANDKGPSRRWESIRARLARAGFAGIPRAHDERGTVFELSLRPQTPRTVRFAVWVMPDNRSHGVLEDFVAALIRDDDAMLPLVDGFLNSIPEAIRRFTPAHRPHARIHSWLAVSERPGRPMGQAIKADRRLDAHRPAAQRFLDWIKAALLD